MAKRCTAISLAACALLSSSAALAQQTNTFGTAGRVVVSAERLMGLFVNDSTIETSGPQTILDQTVNVDGKSEGNGVTFAFLGNTEDAGPAGIPRLAVDFFVIDSFSVGGSFVYASRSNEDDRTTAFEVGGATLDEHEKTDTTSSTLAFSPRLGFGRMFTDIVGIWARGGVTYVKGKERIETDTTRGQTDSSNDQETTFNHWAMSLDGLLVLSPFDHFGFGLGPHVDIPLGGSVEIQNTATDGGGSTRSNIESDLSVLSYGVSAGLLGWF